MLDMCEQARNVADCIFPCACIAEIATVYAQGANVYEFLLFVVAAG